MVEWLDTLILLWVTEQATESSNLSERTITS
jgi:hypothetical protein